MNNLQIFQLSIEYLYTVNSPKYNQLKGGFVYAFVSAIDEKEATNKLHVKLQEYNIELKRIEFVSIYDLNTEWEKEQDKKKYSMLYKRAKTSNEIQFDDFYAYEMVNGGVFQICCKE